MSMRESRRAKNLDPGSRGTFVKMTKLRNNILNNLLNKFTLALTCNILACFPQLYLYKMTVIPINVFFFIEIFEEHSRWEFWIRGTLTTFCWSEQKFILINVI